MGAAVIVAVQWDVQRVLAMGAAALSVVFFALAVANSRRPAPIRTGFDVARLVISIAGVAAMALIVGISAPAGVVLGAIGAGVLLGTIQGWSTTLSWQAGRAVATRTVTGVAVWAAGVLVMQVSGVLARTGALRLGQSISWFGVGVLAGLLLGRQARLRDDRQRRAARVGAAAAAVLVAVAALALGAQQAGDASAQPDQQWVLTDTQVDPAGEPPPVGWDVTTTATSMTVVQSFGPDDPSGAEAVFDASWTPPPDRLDPGAELAIPVTVSGRNSGNLETQYFFGLDVILLVDGTWNDAAVGAGANCAQTTVISGVYECSEPVTNTGELRTDVPSSGEDFSVGITALNCSSACQVTWSYELAPAAEATAPDEGEAPPVTADADADAGEVPPVTADADADTDADAAPTSLPPTSLPPTSADADVVAAPTADDAEEIDSDAAVAQAIGGLIAAVAIGLISVAEAAALIDAATGAAPPPEGTDATGAAATSSEVDGALPPPPLAPAASALPPPRPQDATRSAATDQDDPCGWLVDRYRGSLQRWQTVQNQIVALENERWALIQYIERQAESEFWGATSYVATLGLDTFFPDKSAAGIDGLVSTFEQGIRRSVAAQVLQSAMMGEGFDPDAVAEKAINDAIGLQSAQGGDPTQGMFGKFLQDSSTELISRLAGSKALKSVQTSLASGAISAADARMLEADVMDSFARDIGPLLGVGFKAYDLWCKNQQWGEGVERRTRMRRHAGDLANRIHELQQELDEIELERDVDRDQLARCREEQR